MKSREGAKYAAFRGESYICSCLKMGEKKEWKNSAKNCQRLQTACVFFLALELELVVVVMLPKGDENFKTDALQIKILSYITQFCDKRQLWKKKLSSPRHSTQHEYISSGLQALDQTMMINQFRAGLAWNVPKPEWSAAKSNKPEQNTDRFRLAALTTQHTQKLRNQLPATPGGTHYPTTPGGVSHACVVSGKCNAPAVSLL